MLRSTLSTFLFPLFVSAGFGQSSHPTGELFRVNHGGVERSYRLHIPAAVTEVEEKHPLFRGYLMQGLGVLAKNRWLPLIFTSTLFGLMHIANPEIGKLGYMLMVYYIGTGFLLGIMTLMDEGLELALGFHAANNLIAALLLTADWTAFQTNSILKDISVPEMSNLEVFFPVFVIYPLILIVFSKKYQWTDWKEKLFGSVTAD